MSEKTNKINLCDSCKLRLDLRNMGNIYLEPDRVVWCAAYETKLTDEVYECKEYQNIYEQKPVFRVDFRKTALESKLIEKWRVKQHMEPEKGSTSGINKIFRD